MLSVAFGLADNRDILAFQTMDSVVSASNIRAVSPQTRKQGCAKYARSLHPSAITWSIMASPHWFTPIAAALFMHCVLRQ